MPIHLHILIIIHTTFLTFATLAAISAFDSVDPPSVPPVLPPVSLLSSLSLMSPLIAFKLKYILSVLHNFKGFQKFFQNRHI